MEHPAGQFGTGQARVEQVELLGQDGTPLKLLMAAQRVRLRLGGRALTDIDAPIAGFFVKNRLGEYLLGGNTLKQLPDWRFVRAGSRFVVEFAFRMPLFATGDYIVGVAIAAGTQERHVQHHWVHDALHFTAEADPAMMGWIAIEDLACRVGEPEPADERA